MKHIKFIFLTSLLSCINLYAQYTDIPDQGFEQALINLGIDSEATLDGKVLTSDIENVEELDFRFISYGSISDFTGLEDFTSLKELNLKNLFLYIEELDLSILPQLEVFRTRGHTDYMDSSLLRVIFSNNPNLRKIDLYNDWLIQSIDLRDSDSEIDSLAIEYTPNFIITRPATATSNNSKLCVKVTDPAAATSKTGAYENWIDYNTVFYTTEDCRLNMEDYELSAFKVYPNPSQNFFQIDSPLDITSLSLYDISGKEVKSYEQAQGTYNISDLSSGIYLLKIKFETGDVLTKKLVKE